MYGASILVLAHDNTKKKINMQILIPTVLHKRVQTGSSDVRVYTFPASAYIVRVPHKFNLKNCMHVFWNILLALQEYLF